MTSLTGLSDLLRELEPVRSSGGRIVFTNGCFDVLHRGHVENLAQARRLGDVLVVGLNSDDSVRRLKGEGRPLNCLEDRAAVLKALRSVDYVIEFEEDTPTELIERLSPHVLVKGGDYRRDQVAGRDWVESHGGQVVILQQVQGRSTSALLERARRLQGREGSTRA